MGDNFRDRNVSDIAVISAYDFGCTGFGIEIEIETVNKSVIGFSLKTYANGN